MPQPVIPALFVIPIAVVGAFVLGAITIAITIAILRAVVVLILCSVCLRVLPIVVLILGRSVYGKAAAPNSQRERECA